jgi:hypothetical protein
MKRRGVHSTLFAEIDLASQNSWCYRFSMTFTTGDKVPYAPPATVIDVLRRYRDRGIPGPLTRETLERAGVAESLAPRTLQTFRLLGLIDDEGNPEPIFAEANRLPEPGYLESMSNLVCLAYSEVLAFADPSADSYDKVRDAFRPYDPQGQQDRMVVLFLGLLDYVGIDTSAASQSRTRVEANSTTTKPRKGVASVTPSGKQGARSKSKETVLKRTVRRRPGGGDDGLSDLSPGIAGLLRQIPSEGETWTSQSRDRFLNAFAAVLDFAVAVDDSPTDNGSGAQSGEVE